jgi:hypothetical protein
LTSFDTSPKCARRVLVRPLAVLAPIDWNLMAVTWAFSRKAIAAGGFVPSRFPRPLRVAFPSSEACARHWGNSPFSLAV